MTDQTIALLNAVVCFIVWSAVLYAGADHPPPPGFVVAVQFAMHVEPETIQGWQANNRNARDGMSHDD